MPFSPTKIKYTCQNYTLNPAQEQEESASLNVPDTAVQTAISSVLNTVATLCKREGRWGKKTSSTNGRQRLLLFLKLFLYYF